MSSAEAEDHVPLNSYMVLGTRFDVDASFTVLDAVGQGAYGVVSAARHEPSNTMVAIKKITCVFEHQTFTKRTLREIKLLRLLQHENIIGIDSLLRPLNPGFEDIYIVSHLMETDLASIIKSPQPLTDEHCQFFLYQVLRGLKYIHSSCVMHRDLKPRNLLVNSNCDLKICDFGLARVDFPGNRGKSVAMTDYVATRWYRAPEIILSWRHYTKAIDMWSIGCILAELLRRRPLFPGENTNHQLMLIIDMLGSPTPEVVDQVHDPEIREFLLTLPHTDPKPFEELFPEATDEALDLLSRLLVIDPDRRCTVDEALEHPYLASLHCPEDEPAGEPLERSAFEFERTCSSVEDLRDEILNEVQLYHDGPPIIHPHGDGGEDDGPETHGASRRAGDNPALSSEGEETGGFDMSQMSEALPAGAKK